MAEEQGFYSRQGHEVFTFPVRPDRLWVLPSPLSKRYRWRGAILESKSAEDVKLTTSASPYVLMVSYLYLIKRKAINLYSQHYKKPINTLPGKNADILI
jgi:hypothetical protein